MGTPDERLLRYTAWFGRGAMAFVYVYFGLLKIIGVSPAENVVTLLHAHTIPFIPIHSFLVMLGIGETIIGLIFLWPKITKLTCIIFILHMITTILPLAVLPKETWSNFLVPTLTGQYIMKNIVLIALAAYIYTTNKILLNKTPYGNS